MSLSVVIPNYNSARTILDTLAGVLAQDIAATDIILVDDHSTDNGPELVRTRHPGVRILQNPTNLGAAATRNRGLTLASTEWVLFVDADVRLARGCLHQLLSATEQADIIFPTIMYPNGERMYPIGERQTRYLLITPIFLLRRCALTLPDAMFDETYETYCEDTDFFLRTFLFGARCCYVPQAVAVHNVEIHRRNLERRYYLEIRNAVRGAVKFLGTSGIETLDHAFKLGNILRVLACGAFNFNLFDMQARGYRKFSGLRYSVGVLLSRHDLITPNGSGRLLLLTLRALAWNIRQFPATWRSRHALRRSLTCAQHEAQSG
jgi:GT2 family glycosyltransferase